MNPRWLEAAEAAADAARAEVLPRFRTLREVERKEAASPIVTEADLAAERAMRAVLAERTPDAGILGEELGLERPDAPWRWVLDPIDGTIAFACGKPLFTTLIALLHEGRPVLGIIDQPVTGDRWVGAPGGTTLSGRPVQARAGVPLARARAASTAPRLVPPDVLAALEARVHVFSWGGDAYNYGALAAGQLDVVLEAGLAAHDYAALVPVIRGAGGLVTDWDGRPLDRCDGPADVLACGCPELHREVLGLLSRRSGR